MPPVGRWAPTPSGLLHLGNARTALLAWLSIRSQGGTFIWRIEDLDPPREKPGTADAALRDLEWLGLDWDAGPIQGGPHAPYLQSQRSDFYEAALKHLAEAGRLFPCARSRREIASMTTAPHPGEAPLPYPASLRPDNLPNDWYKAYLAGEYPEAALRFIVRNEVLEIEDLVQEAYQENPAQTVGDFPVKRRDGLYAYQLAVVVDDLEMGVTEVVRGSDIGTSTARQIQLIEALRGKRPVYGHVPLLIAPTGSKLSKRDQSTSIQEVREAGVSAEEVVGYLAWSVGLIPEMAPVAAQELVPFYRWEQVVRQDTAVPIPGAWVI